MHDSIRAEVINADFENVLLLKCTTLLKKSFFVGCVYNSPSNSKPKFIGDLDSFLEEFCENIDCLYLISDMNIDLYNHDGATQRYMNVLRNHGVEQIVADATRIGERSSTLIDHIICNRNMVLSSEVIPLTITDHYAIFVTTPYEIRENRASIRKQCISFLHSEYDYRSMLLDLERQLSNVEYHNEPNIDMESFICVLVSVIQNIP